MSRPIYEPSLPRADAELGYGNRQLFRRPSPRSEACCEFAYLVGASDSTVPSGVWTNPADDDPYSEGYVTDGDMFTVDLDTGIILCGPAGGYLATGWAQFEGFDDGDFIAVGIDLGNAGTFSAFRVMNAAIYNTVAGSGMVLSVAAPFFNVVGAPGYDSARLVVIHNTGVDENISDTQLYVQYLGGPDGTFYP